MLLVLIILISILMALGDSLNIFVDPRPFLTEPDTNAPPIPPRNLNAVATGSDFVELSWSPSPIGDLAGYKICFDSDNSGFPYADTINIGNDTTFMLTDLFVGTTYYIAVICYDNSGDESWYSREISVTTEIHPEVRGDVNCDGQITPGDALCTFWRSISGSFQSECFCESSERAAEVNCDGQITPGDALCIFWRSILGEWTPECSVLCVCRSSGKEFSKILSTNLINLPILESYPGEIIKVPICIKELRNLQAFSMDFSYPENIVEFQGILKTNLTENWIALDGVASGTGIITIGGFDTVGVSMDTATKIIDVIFKVRQNANGLGELNLINLTDDLAGTDVEKGSIFLSNMPLICVLSQNYPNPFNPTTSIRYSVVSEQFPVQVTLRIYNILGEKIRTLVDEVQKSGYYSVTWDGRNRRGDEAPSGVYFYHLRAGNFSDTKCMLLLK